MSRRPVSTYRFQFQRGFAFDDAIAQLDYLKGLGITDVYASPLFRPRQGSLHGYDVASWSELNPEIGRDEGFKRFTSALKSKELGLLLDIVPNHMAADCQNPWWVQALEEGPNGETAWFFDIRWNERGEPHRFARLLLPVLGSTFGETVENKELTVGWDAGLHFAYFEHRFPITPKSYATFFGHGAEKLIRNLEGEDAERFRDLLDTGRNLPSPLQKKAPEGTAEKYRAYKADWIRFVNERQIVREHLNETLAWFNGEHGRESGTALLDNLHGEQPYRLSFWRMANEAVNYRRFFDINELVCLRVENAHVFDEVHRRILEMVKDGDITGLRIDHVDGLRDPYRYLLRLRESLKAIGKESTYVVVEKILGDQEEIPEAWPVEGTTGYDFNAYANGIFVDQHGLKYLEGSYARFTGNRDTFHDVVRQAKLFVLTHLFAGEMERLSEHLQRLAAAHRIARDLPRRQLRAALAAVTASLEVYRTYLGEATPQLDRTDRARVEKALEEARRRTGTDEAPPEAFDFLHEVLLIEPPVYLAHEREAWAEFVSAWQQLSGPAMAKGLEDTAFFRHPRLVSLNDVGSTAEEVDHPPDVAAFHRFHAARLRRWPYAMNTTSTHDTKRSGDVNGRINVLSELPFTWARAFRRWKKLNARHKETVGGRPVPDATEEILLYQTMIGAWPMSTDEEPSFRERLKHFMTKALREAKRNSNWLRPNLTYEAALLQFIDKIADAEHAEEFLGHFKKLHERVAFYGAINSLAQATLRLTSPGMPDTYQGHELWDFSMTDPDNRRPVDYALRQRLLNTQANGGIDPKRLMADWQTGAIKLFVTQKLLTSRRAQPTLFLDGDYIPLRLTGSHREHALAFARRHGDKWLVVVVPRLSTKLVSQGRWPIGRRTWGSTAVELPVDAPQTWDSMFNGKPLHTEGPEPRILHLADVLTKFPIGVLEGSRLESRV